MTPQTHHLLDTLADSVDPALALLALLAPLLKKPRALGPTLAYYAAAGLAIACVYLVRALDQRYQLWAAFGLDYSTHTAFAASLVTSMVALERRWFVPLLAALGAYFGLVLVMRYHGGLDVVTSASLAAALAWSAQLGFGRMAAADERRGGHLRP